MLLGVACSLLFGFFGGILGYIVAAYVSLRVWPDLQESNLAGLPAVLFGFMPGLFAGAVGGVLVWYRLTRNR
jgi:hypothetical protein